jgi:hypothetical protein
MSTIRFPRTCTATHPHESIIAGRVIYPFSADYRGAFLRACVRDAFAAEVLGSHLDLVFGRGSEAGGCCD